MTETAEESWLADACARAVRINEGNLLTLLSDNRNTEFGKEHNFASIRSPEEYKKAVPLSTYEEVHTYVERMKAGERDVLTVYPIAGFCRTSGTEGTPKYIPVSTAALERYSDKIEWYKNRAHRQAGGRRLFVNGFRVGLEQKKEEYLLSELYYRNLFQKGLLPFSEFAGGQETLFWQNGHDMLYGKVWTALASEDITTLESIFLYDQLLFFQYLQKHWRSILKAMKAGSIPDRIRMPEEEKAVLLKLPVSPERLRRYLGDVPVYYFAYVASECHMGVALRPEECRYVMLPESAFYEYLPWRQDGESGTEETLLPEQVQKGGLYEVVLTNFSGLYRYRLGDVIRVVDFLGESPVVEFVLRKNQFLNVAGEKMSICQAEQAVRKLVRRYGLPVHRYCIGQLPWESPSCYGAVFEWEERESSGNEPDAGLAARRLDRALEEQNLDYQDVRRLGFLKRLEVLFLGAQEYDAFLEENGLTGGHNRPRHAAGVIREEVWKKWKERQRT